MINLNKLISISKNLGPFPIIACIGSTKDISDSLGPITGQLLKEKYKTNAIIIGSLCSPLHALNLTTKLDLVKTQYPKSKIIAVDACYGRDEKPTIKLVEGGIKPGLATGKNLPKVGDYSIVASTYNNYNQCLGEVYLLADKIARLINYVVSIC